MTLTSTTKSCFGSNIHDKERTLTKTFVPSACPGDWKALLADPEKQWACGKSARSLAHCWEDCGGFPREVRKILRQSNALREIEPLLIFPEWKVPLPGGVSASQNDVWVLAKTLDGLVSIAVEGKVDEPFDRTLEDWKADASPGKQERLEYLVSCLGLNCEPPGHIYYQLMHRTASAIIEAERFGTKAAVMLVHTFSPEDKWFTEYCEFSRLFGIEAEIGVLGTTQARNELPLYLGWVHGDERYLCS